MITNLLLTAITVGFVCYLVAVIHAHSRPQTKAPKWEVVLGLGGFTVASVAAVALVLREIWA